MRTGSVAECAGKPAEVPVETPAAAGFRVVFAVEDRATPLLRQSDVELRRMRQAMELEARFRPVRIAVAQVIARESEIAHGEILRAAKVARRSIGQQCRRAIEGIQARQLAAQFLDSIPAFIDGLGTGR